MNKWFRKHWFVLCNVKYTRNEIYFFQRIQKRQRKYNDEKKYENEKKSNVVNFLRFTTLLT